MSRTSRYKLGYAAVILFAGGAVAWFLYVQRPGPWTTLLLALLLLVPGRIQGALWREFFRGRHLLTANDPHGAIPHLERFLVQVRERPWLKRLIWLSWGTYTRDIEVMTLTNLGAAHMALGDLGAARRALEAARVLDALAPLTYFNLASIEEAEGNAEEAARLFEQARSLGFAGSTSDRMVGKAGELLARAEGHGAKRSA